MMLHQKDKNIVRHAARRGFIEFPTSPWMASMKMVQGCGHAIDARNRKEAEQLGDELIGYWFGKGLTEPPAVFQQDEPGTVKDDDY